MRMDPRGLQSPKPFQPFIFSMQHDRKRLRCGENTHAPPPQSTLLTASSSSSSKSSSPASLLLLQTELCGLRTELAHSQSIRSIERRDAAQLEERLKHRLADAYDETAQCRDIIDSLKAQIDGHSTAMEESRREWTETIKWYEERWEREKGEDVNEEKDGDRCGGRCTLLQQKLDAALGQVRGLEDCLRESEERRISAEMSTANANNAQFNKLEGGEIERDDDNTRGGDGVAVEIPRDLRIKIAETERENRELRRRNDTLASKVKDAMQDKECAALALRKVDRLEREVQVLVRQVEEGREATRQWLQFRNDLVEDGGMLLDGQLDENDGSFSIAVPPEIWTVVRKFRTLKRDASRREEEVARATQLSETNTRRTKNLEAQLDEASRSIAKLKQTVDNRDATISRLEVENRKYVAREDIWKRESEGLRSLLDTYERQETTMRQQHPSSSKTQTNNSDGLQLSLNSAREEMKLLSDTNVKLEATIDKLETERKSIKEEHDRVLDKFGKLREALMEERTKAETAAIRAAKAETLAGTGVYNLDTTKVVHLQSNPVTDAMREKFMAEIESLKRRLEDAECATIATTTSLSSTKTPAANKNRGSFGSASSGDSSNNTNNLDSQKLHERLKEQFRNQIALFRQGVYLLTGFKIDMTQSDSDCQIFTVRSIYGENEGDQLVFKWSPKKKSKLDMLNTDMAHLLMQGPSGIYVTEHGSWPGFLASVTLQLFDQQTML